MKTYTFKIKSYDVPENISPVVIAINCPLEVMYNSVKACKELFDFNGFITQTDYFDFHTNDYGSVISTWVDNDVFVGDVQALIMSEDLKDFLLHNTYKKEDYKSDEIQESV